MYYNNLESLQELGFTRNEALVYMAGLRLGPSKASVIALEAQIDRVQTYAVLGSLEQKALVSAQGSHHKTVFTMEPPQRLLVLAEQQKQQALLREKRAAATVKHLQKSLGSIKSPSSKTEVRTYAGSTGIKNAANEIVEKIRGNTIYSLAPIKHMLDAVEGSFIADWFEQLNKKGITSKSIWSAAHTLPDYQRSLRDLRIAPSVMNIRANIMIYDDTVVFFTPPPELRTIIIENVAVADTLRSMHEQTWNNSSPIPTRLDR